MLPDEANILKQKKREEQLKNWRERETSDTQKQGNDYDKQQLSIQPKRSSKVKFPQGCVFLAACAANDLDEVKYYLKMGVNINTTNVDGLTALHQACIDDNFTMVRFLVDNNADLNPQDNEGWTPLHAAVSVGNLDVAKFLISKGAKLNVCNFDSDLPIDLCDPSNEQMRHYLEEEMNRQGIDVDYEKSREELIMYEDAKDSAFRDKTHPKTGATPLHVSAAKGYTRVMKLLIQAGANVNATDKDGWTPLHAAAHWEQEEACKILAENGASFEMKNYSGQTALDVCDDDMINKLKAIQTKVKQMNKEKSIELTAIVVNSNGTSPTTNNNSTTNNNVLQRPQTTDSRSARRSSEELRSSIIRSTLEAKSSISEKEKKQEKILLSPDSQKDIDFDSDNSDNEKSTNDDNSTNNNNNRNSSSLSKENNLNSINNSNSSIASSNNDNVNNDNEQLQKQLKAQRTKSGLQESLKSLSAQVKMNMDEDKDDKMRWGSTSSNETAYKRRVVGTTVTPTLQTATIDNNKPSSTTTTTTSETTPAPNTNEEVSLSPISSDALLSLKNSETRRYSSAPVASKDEQAELIRKQKAKLERHYRRSTQAVSYEDIKSAEATIKASSGDSSSTTTSPPPPLPSQPPPSASSSSTTPSSSSSLSTIVSPQLSLSSSSASSTTLPSSTTKSLNDDSTASSSATLSTTAATTTTTTTSNHYTTPYTSQINSQQPKEEITDRDAIIAKDIETDKLLYAIEKSKGFSDSYSTTRRLRNRSSALNNSLLNNDTNINNENNIINNTATNNNNNNNNSIKKINKLIWNEEKLEVEYRDKTEEDSPLLQQHQQQFQNINSLQAINNNNFTTNNTNSINNISNNIIANSVIRRQNSAPEASKLLNNNNLNTTNPYSSLPPLTATTPTTPTSATTPTSNTTTPSNPSLPTSPTSSNQQQQQQQSQQTHNSRQIFRFLSNDSTASTNSNASTTSNSTTNTAARSNIKRSVSQANTDRRPISDNSVDYNKGMNSYHTTDDRQLIENLEKENERLKESIKSLQKELEEQAKRTQLAEAGFADKREKRACDRKISELEEELKKMENLKQDNTRLKEENAALIRVISKLSK